MFGSIGGPELILIFLVALLIFGPRKLPELGRMVGRGLGEFRRAANDLKVSLETEVARESATRPLPPAGAATAPGSDAAGAAGVTAEAGRPAGHSGGAPIPTPAPGAQARPRPGAPPPDDETSRAASPDPSPAPSEPDGRELERPR